MKLTLICLGLVVVVALVAPATAQLSAAQLQQMENQIETDMESKMAAMCANYCANNKGGPNMVSKNYYFSGIQSCRRSFSGSSLGPQIVKVKENLITSRVFKYMACTLFIHLIDNGYLNNIINVM
jgi:hypothetical protein